LRCERARELLDLTGELALFAGKPDTASAGAERRKRAVQLDVAVSGRSHDERSPRKSCARVGGRSSLRSGSGVVIRRSEAVRLPV
jgi:hypothetical protein